MRPATGAAGVTAFIGLGAATFVGAPKRVPIRYRIRSAT